MIDEKSASASAFAFELATANLSAVYRLLQKDYRETVLACLIALLSSNVLTSADAEIAHAQNRMQTL